MQTMWWSASASVAFVLVALAFVRGRTSRAHTRRATRAALGVTGLLWLASGPRATQQVPVPAEHEVLLVIDDSASMRLPQTPGGPSRFDAACSQALSLTQRVQARLLADGNQALRLRTTTLSGESFGATAMPSAPETRWLGPLARHIAGGESPVAAAVLLSDGATQETDLSEAASTLHVPVHVVPIGETLPDVAISQVRHGEFAFIKTDTTIEVDVILRGAKERIVQVALSDADRRLGETSTRLVPDKVSTVTFRLRAERIGTMTLEASVSSLPDEIDTQNNVRASSLQILRDKTRVLHVLGAPSIDGRFVREALLSQRNVDVVSFFILRTPTNEAVVSEQELSLIPFPVQQLFTTELKNFDAVILQNFDPRPFGMQPFVGHLAEAVRQGLGLAMVGGPQSFADGGWHESPLADVLPVVSRPTPKGVSVQPQLPRLAAQAAWHPLFAGFAPPGQTPPSVPCALSAWHDVGPLLPGASALLTVADEPPRPGVPVLAARDVGEGRVVSLATNESWRWAFAPEERGRAWLFRLWHNILSYLAKDTGDARLSIAIESDALQSREGFGARVRALDGNWQAAAALPVDLSVTPLPSALPHGAPLPPWHAQVVTDAQGVASAQREPLPPGRYRVEARTQGNDPLVARRDVAILPSVEQDDIEPHPERLAALALATGGQVLGPQDAPLVSELADVPAVRHIAADRPLWPRTALVVATLLLLLSHWLCSTRLDFGASEGRARP